MNYKDFESKACFVYQNKGFRLIAKNFRGMGYEIDLIFQKNNLIQLVEVKASILDPDVIARKFINKQFKCYKRFIAKMETSDLSSFNLSLDLIIFANKKLKDLEFKCYKIF